MYNDIEIGVDGETYKVDQEKERLERDKTHYSYKGKQYLNSDERSHPM